MPPEFEDDELEGLSPEELAAIGDDDDEAAILQSIAGEDDDSDDDGSDGAADDDADTDADSDADRDAEHDEADHDAVAGDADGAAGAERTAQPEANTAEDDAASPSHDEDRFQPTFRAEVPADLEQKFADIDNRAKALMERLEEGEIDLPAFMAQNQVLTDERMQLRIAQEQARWADRQNDTAREQRWQWEQERFFAQEKSAIYKDPIVLAALDASVKQLAIDPANTKRPAGWFLDEADRLVRERMNIGAPRQEKAQKQNRQPDLTGAPKTLANLPAAELPETGADEFAYLEKLLDKDPMAYEAALRKLTPEQEARYLGVA